jgi:soluble lytic murein transglycosylase
MHLVETYIALEKYHTAIETANDIHNKTLQQKAQLSKIKAHLGLQDTEAAIGALSRYIRQYPLAWESKLFLARLFQNNNDSDNAVRLFKEIYINENPFSSEALKELMALKADDFTQREMLQRAETLFQNREYKKSEAFYKDVINKMDDSTEKNEIRFSIGMCQFRQKKYEVAAQSFKTLTDPEPMFWRARALFRSKGMAEFEKVIEQLKRNHPQSKYLVRLLLSLADEKRRMNKIEDAEKIYKDILHDFPQNAEEALWGLGWMYYTYDKYREAGEIFSQLTSSTKNNEQYLYWKAKSTEMQSENCKLQNVTFNEEDNTCAKIVALYDSLSEKTGYYGFLAQSRRDKYPLYDKVDTLEPKRPEGEIYMRIEALTFVGLESEAKEEIKIALKSRKNTEEFRYLAHRAFVLDEYQSIVYIAEGYNDEMLLPYSYPLGFWKIVKEVAGQLKVDPFIIIALIREESRFDPHAVSSAGARGLMQLMPYTAHRINKELALELSDDSDIHNIGNNISLGTFYFSKLMNEFIRSPLAIAAYNAGENALRRWLSESQHRSLDEFIEDIPYQETRNYVKKVLKSYWQYRTLHGLPLTRDIE